MEIHKLRLVEEVRKRPKLWVRRRKKYSEKLWAEVANVLNADVAKCKRTWQVTRVRYWVESKRISDRIVRAKEKGEYDPNSKYTSWFLFDKLKFLENVEFKQKKKIQIVHRYDERVENSNYLIRKENTGKKCVDKPLLPIKGEVIASRIVPLTDYEIFRQKTTNFHSYQEKECYAISNDGNIIFKKDPETQVESGTYTTLVEDTDVAHSKFLAEPEQIHNFEPDVTEIKSSPEPEKIHNFKADVQEIKSSPEPEKIQSFEADVQEIKPSPELEQIHNFEPNRNTDEILSIIETLTSRAPDTIDEDYIFLYSFLGKTKQMSLLQKSEFHVKMRALLLDIFPAAGSASISESQFLLSDLDYDPDKKFLISFWPFLKSISFSQNLEFRAEMADLVLSFFSKRRKRKFN